MGLFKTFSIPQLHQQDDHGAALSTVTRALSLIKLHQVQEPDQQQAKETAMATTTSITPKQRQNSGCDGNLTRTTIKAVHDKQNDDDDDADDNDSRISPLLFAALHLASLPPLMPQRQTSTGTSTIGTTPIMPSSRRTQCSAPLLSILKKNNNKTGRKGVEATNSSSSTASISSFISSCSSSASAASRRLDVSPTEKD
jgi:hypothetical protein